MTAMAISNSALANLLGRDTTFIGRVASILCAQATTVLSEQGVGETHSQRARYAQNVIQNPTLTATLAAPYLAGSTNVIGTITIEDSGVVTSVTDPALLSQVASSWDALAGIDSGN